MTWLGIGVKGPAGGPADWVMVMRLLQRFSQFSRMLRSGAALVLLANSLACAGAAEPAKAPERKLEPGDTVELDVHLEPKVSGIFSVDQLGYLKIPLLGRLLVKGLTEQDLANQVEAGLEKSFIRDASVAVHITERRSLSVSVMGKVNSPGPVSFQAGQTLGLYQALVSAGMTTPDADTRKIEIVRESGDSIKTFTINADNERMYPLQEGDTVVVPALPPEEASQIQAKFVTMLGQVATPGRIEITPGQPLDILTAIAKAGGLTRTARESKVTVHRKGQEGKADEKLIIDFSRIQRGEQEPFPLQEGDTVFVPESFF